jgi:hypothetical protein
VSTIKVDSIQSSDGNTDLLTLSNGSVSGVNFGRRNLIINGAMQVAQRGTSFSVDNAFVVTVDRFKVVDGSAGSFTVTQSTDTPDNFKNSLKIEVASADTSIATSDYAWLQYAVEGNDCAHLGLGQSSAQTFTLSFWAKSSVTGTFSGGFENYDGGRGYAFTYTINSANTWEYKTVTVAGDTGGGNWKTDNRAGLYIYLDLGTGTDRTVSSAGSWFASRSVGTDGGQKLVSINGATLYITGVQLEVGSVATPFEHRSYGEELALCQRYYEIIARDSGTSGYGTLWSQPLNTFSNIWTPVRYAVTKRASPTFGLFSGVSWSTGSGTPTAHLDSREAVLFYHNNYFYLDGGSGGDAPMAYVDAEL